MFWLPGGIIHKGFEPLGECEEPVQVSTVRRVGGTLHDGRVEVGFCEEGVTYKVLVLLRGEECVSGYNMGVLGAKALRCRREVGVRRVVARVGRRVLVACVPAMTSTDGCGGHCIEMSTR